MQNGNSFEVAARAQKSLALAGSLMVHALVRGEDVLSPAFVEKLRAAGQDFWKQAAEESGQIMPSIETQAAVIAFFAAAVSRAQSLVSVPTQARASA